MVRVLALILTVLTGFSALVYEIAWQKYLSALLGSQSEATVAVLAIFLGALSYGYALFGRVAQKLAQRAAHAERPPRLLLAYGFVEIAIGVYALLFPWIFDLVWKGSLWLPVGSPAGSFAIDFALSALLIGPPAVLMGATIPLLTQALSRGVEDSTRLHALVYGTNTVGSTAGALSAGFVLVPWLGLDGSVWAMGVANVLAGLALVALGRAGHESLPVEARSPSPVELRGLRAFLFVALLSGFATMTLQVIMNRIGALSLGASHFTFSMVVATFVLCIALGSFAVARLSVIPPYVLPASLWALVGYLLVLYPFVDDAPYWAHRLRTSFPSEASDFYRFHFAVLLWILGLFIVPLGIAGATLPLLFHHLRRQLVDLGSVAGRLYSWNTLGSLTGALVGGYLLFFWLDLHQVFRVAVFAMAVTAALASVQMLSRGVRVAVPLTALCAVALVLLPAWSPKQLSAGLFRTRTASSFTNAGVSEFWTRYRSNWNDDYIAFYRDDPSNSIAVNRKTLGADAVSISIINNGKNDSAIPDDDVTTSFLALLPALFAESRERAFVIGYGTGKTVGELIALGDVEEVVVAEISQGVIDAAPLFDPYNGNASQDSRVRIVRSDAYRLLQQGDDEFDLIISEPSTPWVAGVEMLFSLDFLEAARSRLAPGGVFLQWFHTYEMDGETIELVFETLRTVFPRSAIWYGRGFDLMILGFHADARIELNDLQMRWEQEDLRRRFAELGIRELPQLLAHELLPMDVLSELELAPRIHTIANPKLSHQAALAFYRGQSAELPDFAIPGAMAVGRRESMLGRYRVEEGWSDTAREQVIRETCRYRLRPCATLFAEWLSEDRESLALSRLLSNARASREHRDLLAPESLGVLAELFDETQASEALTPERIAQLEHVYQNFYHYGAPFPDDAISKLRTKEPSHVRGE